VAAPLRFEWDPRKAAANIRRHRVSFEEASTAFYDDDAILIDDPEHSQGEARFVLLGLSARFRLLVIPHSYRSGDSVIRIISAWRADRRDQLDYFGRFSQ
jgi:uncharacterized DUF497 family protein